MSFMLSYRWLVVYLSLRVAAKKIAADSKKLNGRRVTRGRNQCVQSPTRTLHERCDYFRVLWAIFGSAHKQPMTRDSVKNSRIAISEFWPQGIVLEHEHPIQEPQTAGEGRRVDRC